MADHNCTACKFRKKYDDDPKSFLGKIWRFHANWCPGWKGYITSLPDTERQEIAKNYDMKKYMG